MDLRGGEVTNEALEHEVLPIMNEFKVRTSHGRSSQEMLSHAGSRHLCRVFREATRQRSGGVLPRAEGRTSSDRPSVRFSRPRRYSCAMRVRSVLTTRTLQVLKKECVAALRRIFKLCDLNKDGVLDSAELNEFQVASIFAKSCNMTKALIRGNVSTHLYKLKN